MHPSRLERFRAVTFAVAIHVVAVLLLTVSLRFDTTAVVPAHNPGKVMNAVAVDERQVEAEVKRLREAETRREQKVKDAERKRREEEEKLNKLKEEIQRKKADEEQRQKEVEEKRKVQEDERRKIALAEKQKAEEEKKRQEEERARIEEEKQKAIEENKRIEEERRQQVEEERKKARADKKRHEEEALERERQEELAADERERLAAAQERADSGVVDEYIARIRDRIQSVFINPNPEQKLSCTLYVRMSPAGDVIDARVEQSSGIAPFDRQAEIAVRKASPLPVPADPRIFAKMREVRFVFEPEG